jgi:hypothetical protein
MREKIRLSDNHFVYICWSKTSDTLARKCLSDAVYFRNTGGEVTLICLDDSFLSRSAKKEDLNIVALEHHDSYFRMCLNMVKLLKKLMLDHPVDLIHCYHYNTLLAVGFVLKRISPIPLFFTCNEDVSRLYRGWWHDFFIHRIDQVLTFAPSIKDEVSQIIPIEERKIHTIGVGIEANLPAVPKVAEHYDWKLCSIVLEGDKQISGLLLILRTLEPLIYSLKKINSKHEVILNLLSDVPWEQHQAYLAIKSLVLERGLSQMVFFVHRPNRHDFFLGQDIYVAYDAHELFNDSELWALLSHVPIVVPRTSAREQMINSKKLGLSYFLGDGRELKDRIIEMIQTYSWKMKALDEFIPQLIESHDYDRYVTDLSLDYEKALARRRRFVLMKSKKAYG